MIETIALQGTADPTGASGNWFESNLINIALFALLAIVIIFMFRNSRKRRRDQDEMQDKMVPGAEVITQAGIYGTLVSIDDESNQAIIETTKGTKLRIHRQVIVRVVDPDTAESAAIESAVARSRVGKAKADEDSAEAGSDPEYGERVDDAKPKRAPRKKPGE